MELLVAYDVATDTKEGRRRLRRVANVCVAHGQRVQKSVFECVLTEVQVERFTYRLLKEIEPSQDSLRIYRLREPREQFTQVFGVPPPLDFGGTLIA
ncbi:MAG: CRISPR-associated endonuclease Cas2 [Dehalococcoidia bacterium]